MIPQIWIDIIGYVGSSSIALSAPLQFRKSFKCESTGDISWKWIFSYLLGICLIFLYSVLLDLPPVYGPMCVEIFFSFLLLLLKIKYDVIQHKTYFMEMSTQTEPEDFAEGKCAGGLEISNVSSDRGNEVYVQVKTVEVEMI